jgi:hypothetical protein
MEHLVRGLPQPGPAMKTRSKNRCDSTIQAFSSPVARGQTACRESLLERRPAACHRPLIKRGESVTFVNSDPFTHNVYSMTTGMSFDLHVQKPGQQDVVTFETAGEAAVQCAIHPQMKLEIRVAPKRAA